MTAGPSQKQHQGLLVFEQVMIQDFAEDVLRCNFLTYMYILVSFLDFSYKVIASCKQIRTSDTLWLRRGHGTGVNPFVRTDQMERGLYQWY